VKKGMPGEQEPLGSPLRQLRILFIGNSHTYRHDIPSTLVRMAKALKPPVNIAIDSRVGEGASLAWHWENPETIQNIERGNWDYAVLQERSDGPLEDRLSMEKYGISFGRTIRDSGARTILYMTWARRDRPETQSAIVKAYKNLQKQTGALLAPVGSVWDRCRSMFPGMNLYDPDGRHANTLGAYLSACTFFSLICKRSPEGLAETIFSRERCSSFGGKERLAALERIAYEVVARTMQPA
jgi:hypothetical protein